MATWIFQGNPDEYDDLNGYLKKEEIIWGINQKKIISDIKIGDDVYIWKSKGKNSDIVGIVALGNIMSKPTKMPDDEPQRFVDPKKIEEAKTDKKYRVIIKIKERRFNRRDGMLEKDTIRNNIREFPVVKMPRATNYLLKQCHADCINELWEQRKKRKG